MTKISYAGYRFPPEVIHQAIWLYLRFTLSFRDVEDLLVERGIAVSYETVRRWVNHFGPMIAGRLRKRRPKPHATWHLDEVYLKIDGRMVYLWRAGANADLLPVDIERVADDLKTCDLILLQLEIPLETVYATIEFGKRHGIKTLLNPAPATSALDLQRILHVSFFVPNETELALLSGLPVEMVPEIEAAARSLIAKGIGTVIVTMGERGALLVTPTETTAIEPVRVTPVDTTGAGDAFIGSFARYYVDTGDVNASLRKAVRYAADSVTRRGTQKAYATREMFEAQ
jgi:ribokinase